ncbi:hypothetical protein BJV82DRAFT_580318 [Fennellomyces sp. T-0311]|nr:hypothetical protein BJV82DRAFT_580318 [Fennellomyces sp. T-0311]
MIDTFEGFDDERSDDEDEDGEREFNNLQDTDEGCFSIRAITKRPHIDYFDTPSPVKRQRVSFEQDLKSLYVDRGLAQLRNHPLTTLTTLPKALDKLIVKGTTYHRLMKPVDDAETLAVRLSLTTIHDQVVHDHAEQLIECVLLSDHAWAFVTCVDAFVMNDLDIDDCAMQGTDEHAERAQALIIDKNLYGTKWKELVVKWGRMEFLVQAAFYGERANTKVYSFLGSSIPRAAVQTFDSQQFKVLVPLEPVETVASIRFLRTYTKKAAHYLWSFNSKRFAHQRYAPTHPLTLDRHNTRMKASIILARKFTAGDRDRAFELLESTQEFSKVSITSWNSRKTISDALKAMEASTPKSGLLLPLRVLAQLDILDGNATDVSISALYDKNLRDSLLKMYTPVMKNCNASTIEEYLK